MNWPATIANSLWIGSSLPSLATFRRALRQPATVQRDLLRALLDRNAECAYGRRHGLREIRSYEEFARRVPMVDYADIEPWIERIRLGESGVLTSESVTHLIPTSGSTGARKLIPFTAGLQREFNAAMGPWICDLAQQHPAILGGPAYWSITPATQPADIEPSAVPIGFADDTSYLGGLKSWLVRLAMVVPNESSRVADLEAFRYHTLLSLLRQRDLRLVSVWHPSFLSLLLDALPDYWDKLLAEIRRTHSDRARELAHADLRRPESLWPHLQVISCWGDRNAALGLADLHRRFPNTRVQPKGLLATEAFVTIPFGEAHPLALRSHYFEFTNSDGRVRLAHELRAGETYGVVVTTSGGLWRYRLGDQVQVTGFVERTPSLRFLGRAQVSDRFGEKLSEVFVSDVLKQLFADLAATPRFVLLAPEQRGAQWHYTLFLESESPMEVIRGELEKALCANPHYAECRRLGQLQPVGLFRIRAGGFKTFTAHEMKRGCRLGDLKPQYLSSDAGWAERFDSEF
ncbi:MAG TPA: GH3 auxin-responsive promoter family protein [Verrucomicrobiae bacterium]